MARSVLRVPFQGSLSQSAGIPSPLRRQRSPAIGVWRSERDSRVDAMFERLVDHHPDIVSHQLGEEFVHPRDRILGGQRFPELPLDRGERSLPGRERATSSSAADRVHHE